MIQSTQSIKLAWIKKLLILLISFDHLDQSLLDLLKPAPQAPLQTITLIKLLISRTLAFPFPPQAMLWFTLFVNVMFSYIGFRAFYLQLKIWLKLFNSVVVRTRSLSLNYIIFLSVFLITDFVAHFSVKILLYYVTSKFIFSSIFGSKPTGLVH